MNLNDSEITQEDTAALHQTIPSQLTNAFKPRYNIKKSIDDVFYRVFYLCLNSMEGVNQAEKYSKLKERLRKYYGFKDLVELGFRYRKRIQPCYMPYLDLEGKRIKVYPTSTAFVLYGIDFLSNKEIIDKFQVQRKFYRRINMSNVLIQFQDKQTAIKSISAFIQDEQNSLFFKVKQQENLPYEEKQKMKATLQNQQAIEQERTQEIQEMIEKEDYEKLPQGWFPLKSYQYSQQFVPCIIRYSTNKQLQQIAFLREQQDFISIYQAAKHVFMQKAKEQQQKNLQERIQQRILIQRSKKFGSKYSSEVSSDINKNSMTQSNKEFRQRSRQRLGTKSKKIHKIEQEELQLGQVFINLEDENYMSNITEQSAQSQISYFNNGQNDSWLQGQKIKTQQQANLVSQFGNLDLNNDDVMTLQQLINQQMGQVNSSGDLQSLQHMNSFYNPMGMNDSYLWERQSQVQKLTKLNPPTKKFKYSQHVQMMMILEQNQRLNRKKNKDSIVVD